MIIPPSLKPSSCIGIVAPAGKIDYNIVVQAAQRIQMKGYKVKIGDNINSSSNYFSAQTDLRSKDMQTMIEDPEVDAILCARGGYGSVQTVQNVDFSPLLTKPKWLIGFSDITVFHNLLNNLNIASLHAQMCKGFLNHSETSSDIEILFSALEGEDLNYLLNPYPSYNRNGKAEGQVIGGNLSVIYSLRGTPYDIDTKGKILFIEDINEYLYSLDRIMNNLKLGNKLNELAGLVVGQFTNMLDTEEPFGKSIEDIILDAVKEYDYPVAFNFPAGHVETNYPLVFGKRAKLNVNDDETQLIYC